MNIYYNINNFTSIEENELIKIFLKKLNKKNENIFIIFNNLKSNNNNNNNIKVATPPPQLFLGN